MRIKITALISLIIISASCCSREYYITGSKEGRVYTGLENFLDNYAEDYSGMKAALITNHSGNDYNLNRNIDLFREKGIEIVLLLAPEHGLYGYQNEYDDNIYTEDKILNSIVYNLHHLNTRSLGHLLKIPDIVIFDIQDMGMRCYTYISNLKFIMDTINKTDKEFIVLDRPNPLGFLGIDGPYLEDGFYSKYISSFPGTFLYNMTIGESALYYKGEFADETRLKVIPLKGYTRDMLFNETMLPWIPPSPNLPTYMSSIVYSAMVFLEGVNISLGRGTAKPFEYIGAPWIEPVSFCNDLKNIGFPNFTFRPVYFMPAFSEYEGIQCGGAQILYTGGKFIPTEVSYKIITYLRRTYKEFEWKIDEGIFGIDRRAGSDKFRRAIIEGKNFREYQTQLREGINKFKDKRQNYLIYADVNQIGFGL